MVGLDDVMTSRDFDDSLDSFEGDFNDSIIFLGSAGVSGAELNCLKGGFGR